MTSAAASCPFCKADRPVSGPGRLPGKDIAGFPEKTYRRCPACGIIYLTRLDAPSVKYDKDYFFDSYKRQYGKTYLEDFPNLLEAGRRRLTHILNAHLCAFVPPCDEFMQKYSLLDIGCAYGPFLAAAAEAGFNPAGIEPVEDAAHYVREKLGFACWQGFFPDALPEEFRTQSNSETNPEPFDVISLWYVIEHFEEPGKMLNEISRLLKNGGVLAFSTPSFSGISGRKSLRSFLKNSPPDHYTVWSPLACKKILKQYGFELRKIVVTGHHPERFPLLGRFVKTGSEGPLYRLLLFISRLFSLGDTFEVYAVKA